MSSIVPTSRNEWQKALAALPAVENGKIPVFFFGHGQPGLIGPRSVSPMNSETFDTMGPKSDQAMFLRDFGPALLQKYKPKSILVFSAHWETSGELLVTDYGDNNPLLMDYYGFDREFYDVKFKSSGNAALAQKTVDLFKKHNLPARTTNIRETRGRDGRGFFGPGLDHGVFVPFKLMFGDETDIPIVEASIDASLSPEKNWEIGKAVTELRSEGVLILSGGLTIHTFKDFSAFSEVTAKPIYKEFNQAVNDAAGINDAFERRKALLALTSHPGFRLSHPREDHFIPIYVAAGCGEDGGARVVSGVYGATTVAFGL